MLDDLWSHPPVRTRLGGHDTVLVDEACDAKVSNFDLQVVVEQQVGGLEIAVDYPPLVQVRHSCMRQPHTSAGYACMAKMGIDWNSLMQMVHEDGHKRSWPVTMGWLQVLAYFTLDGEGPTLSSHSPYPQ